jgi:hypothetical protein
MHYQFPAYLHSAGVFHVAKNLGDDVGQALFGDIKSILPSRNSTVFKVDFLTLGGGDDKIGNWYSTITECFSFLC